MMCGSPLFECVFRPERNGVCNRWVAVVSGIALGIVLLPITAAAGGSLRFQGGPSIDGADRLKIEIDDPGTDRGGPPVDVGRGDFTIEFWMRAAEGNDRPAVDCKDYGFVDGNIIVDRDRYDQGRSFGVSLAAGRIVFSVQTGDYLSGTVCGRSDLRDGRWHHVAVQRDSAGNRLTVFVDGQEEASGYAPGGDVSYPDDGRCGDPSVCADSDHYLVVGAEKHDLGHGFAGWIDELRISDIRRYPGAAMPKAPFEVDRHTVGLYHFDEGRGDRAIDAAEASPGRLTPPAGDGEPSTQWSAESPFPAMAPQ